MHVQLEADKLPNGNSCKGGTHLVSRASDRIDVSRPAMSSHRRDRALPAISATILTLATLLSFPALAVAAPPVHFEPFRDYFTTVGGNLDARIEPGQVRLNRTAATGNTLIRWVGAGSSTLTGEQATGGRSNYYVTADPAAWRPNVPHYNAIRARGLYSGIEVLFHSHGASLEFDVVAAAGSNLAQVLFDVDGPVSVNEGGDLVMRSGGLLFKRPEAWQVVNGQKRTIDCSFRMESRHPGKATSRIGFQIAAYDHAIPLTIDPLVEYTTYLGGNGTDYFQALAADSTGSAILAGSSTSTNFPGAPFGSFVTFSFVTKLSPDASTVAFTTVLGSGPAGAVPTDQLDPIAGVAVDTDGSIYVTGITSQGTRFPITPGAWNVSGVGNEYATKLNPSGQVVYSTYVGGPGWALASDFIRVRNGVAYLGGILSEPAFLGTPGAFQRTIRGSTDIIVIALAVDGSAPLFMTAVGGTSGEILYDMNLDAGGNVLLCGSSTSADFPLAAGSFPYSNAPGQTMAVIARLSSDGTKLLDSTYLGTSAITSIAATSDGSKILMAGNTPLPADLKARGPSHVISLPQNGPQGYVAEMSVSPLQVVWTTSLPVAIGASLQTDAQGYIYYLDSSSWVSGGSPQSLLGGTAMLAPDGSRLQFLGGGIGSFLAVQSVGQVWAADILYSGSFITTGGVVGPAFPVKNNPANVGPPVAGVIARYDLSTMYGENFFVDPVTFVNYSENLGVNVTWRIGQPAPAAVTLPIAFNGNPFPLTFTASNPVLTASLSADSTAIDFTTIPTTAAVAGTTQETVSVADASNPAKVLSIPVTLTIQPQVSIALAVSQVNIEIRYGQAYTPVNIGIVENFGAGNYFGFGLTAFSSNPTWLNGGVLPVDASHAQLTIHVSSIVPGTYDGTITVGIQGLQGGAQTVSVHYVVDPPATIQISPTSLTLQVLNGHSVQPATVNVTGSVTGVSFSVACYCFSGIQAKATGTTPGSIQFTADSMTVAPGLYSLFFLVTGEAGQEIEGTVNLEVSGTPAAVISNVVNAASYWNGISPGEIVVLFGSQLGPAALVSAQPDSSNTFPTTLAGTTVFFDKVAAPIIYTSAGQVAVVAPFEIAGETITSVTVSTVGGQSAPFVEGVSAVSPSIFTADSSGSGQAAALRVAGGVTTIASLSNPVAAGDSLVLYATGMGSLVPAVPDGAIVLPPLPTLGYYPVKVLIGGLSATIQYVGPAPGLVAGVDQINVQIPSNIPSGQATVQLFSNGIPSQILTVATQ